MQPLLKQLKAEYPKLRFKAASSFHWSPETQTVGYKKSMSDPKDAWALLHEVSHGLLSHTTYKSDLELVLLETAAWDKASKVAKKYGLQIDQNHVQDCLDTYRDWLHRRSTCPTCGVRSLQQDTTTYKCFNCSTEWHVSNSRFCRPYRRLKSSLKTAVISN